MKDLVGIIKKQKELIDAHLVYEKLLVDEINEMIGSAYVHGYRSNRYEAGKEIREKIDKIQKEINILE